MGPELHGRARPWPTGASASPPCWSQPCPGLWFCCSPAGPWLSASGTSVLWRCPPRKMGAFLLQPCRALLGQPQVPSTQPQPGGSNGAALGQPLTRQPALSMCFHVGFCCAQKSSASKKSPRGCSFAHPVLEGRCTWPGNGIVRAARCQPTGHPDPSAALEICTHFWVPCHYLTCLQSLQATENVPDHNH